MMYVPTWLTVTFGTQKCLLGYEMRNGIASAHKRLLWGTKRDTKWDSRDAFAMYYTKALSIGGYPARPKNFGNVQNSGRAGYRLSFMVDSV